ncbi:MAG: MMPL family transporter [Gammaproteobacteria bacterium]|nr:MMPL family transporter [Gammaproteobacteria bacterium]
MATDSFALKFGTWIVNHKWRVLFLSLVVILIAGSGVRNLGFITDYRVFFSPDDPKLIAFEALQNTYTKNDNVLYVVAPKNGKVFTRETLASIEQLTKEAWQTPNSIRVDSITNYQFISAEEDELVVQDLVEDSLSLSDADLQRIKTIATTEPLLVNRAISPSGHVTGVNVTIQLPDQKGGGLVPEITRFSRELAEKIKAQNPEIDIYLTGMIFMNNSFQEASQKDMSTLVPLMFLVAVLVVGLLLRVISGTLATVVVIFLSIIAGMGLAGWAGIKLTPPSASAPNIILTIAIADCVHILVSFLYHMRHGMEKKAAMIESIRINLQPVFLTSLTTAIGFLSMNFSDSPPFNDLGNIVAMGVTAAFFFSITTLPALMMALPVKVREGKTRGHHAMSALGEFVINQRGRLLWIMSAAVIVSVAFIPNNELNDEFVKYFDESVDFRKATDFTTENLTGIYLIEYSLKANSKGGVSDPNFLKTVDNFAQWYRQQPETLHVNTVTDIFKRLNQNMHGNDVGWYRLPEERNLAAQYLLLYEMSLPYGLDLNNQINVDKSAVRFTATLKSLSSNDLIALEERAQQWLKDNAPANMRSDGVSPSIMFAHIGKKNIISMLTGTTVALILISLILMIALRSIKIGLISLIPNLVPAAMAFGIWGLFVGEVGLALSVVSGMTLGIVVDDTVHFLSKYLRARREQNKDAYESVRYAFATVGTALWVTSLALVAGFFILTFSTFKLNSGMGLLTAIAIAIALIIDFLLLPPLLMKLEGKKNEKTANTSAKASA